MGSEQNVSSVPHVITTVWWEDDPAITRDVVAYCKRCAQGFEGGEEVEIVSPAGIAHCNGRGEFTKCGINATGLDWWWRL